MQIVPKDKAHRKRIECVTSAFTEFTNAINELEEDDVPAENQFEFAEAVMQVGYLLRVQAIMRGAVPPDVDDEDDDDDNEMEYEE